MNLNAAARRLASPALLPLLLLAAAGCGGPGVAPERHASSVSMRLIPPDGSAVASRDLRLDLALGPSWQAPIDGPSDLAAWSFYVPFAPASRPGRGGGIDLGRLRESRYLIWTGRLNAGAIDVLRFRFRQPIVGLVELYWNGEGEDFTSARYALQPPAPGDPSEVAFELSDSRVWQGTVTRIGLRLVTPPPVGQALLAAAGLRYVAGEGMGGGETRYVTLDGVSMQAWLSRPGITIRRRVEVPSGGVLRLQAASLLAAGGTAGIRVLAQGPVGDPVGSTRILLEGQLQQRPNPPHWRWSRFEADLKEFAGKTIELSFEAAAAPPGSLVIWGNPHLVGTAETAARAGKSEVAARSARPVGASPPNIILISLDTVRADHLSLYGYPRATTPGLAAWAGRWATVFETAVASAPWTLPSHVSMLSGIDAVHHGINRHGPMVSTPALLPERLRDAGYATYATTAGVLLTPQLGFARGFDEFRVRGKMESLPEWDSELARGVNDALGWLNAHRDQRFFLFFHTFEAHSPYQPREPFFTRFGGRREALNAGEPVWLEATGYQSGVRALFALFHPATYAEGVTYPKRVLQASDREVLAALYDSGLAHLDAQLSRLFSYLEAGGLLGNTVVVVTSDHGESLFEHGLVGHSSLYDHDLLVPLVIAAPIAAARGRRVETPVRSVDIVPTLIELAGLEPMLPSDGSSLEPLLRGESSPPRNAWSYALSTARGVSLRTARRKLIAQNTVFEPFRDEFEEYDLVEDPAELRNLAAPAAAERRQHLVREVEAGAAAVELELANAGPGELTGTLSGTAVDRLLTSADLSFPCCWEIADTEVGFRVPAGGRYTLTLPDRAGGGSVELRLAIGGRSWRGALLPIAGPQRLRVAFDGAGWRSEAGAGAPATGVGIQLPGWRAVVPTDQDEVRAKLRALGYLL